MKYKYEISLLALWIIALVAYVLQHKMNLSFKSISPVFLFGMIGSVFILRQAVKEAKKG
jgi:hypothetical protein